MSETCPWELDARKPDIHYIAMDEGGRPNFNTKLLLLAAIGPPHSYQGQHAQDTQPCLPTSRNGLCTCHDLGELGRNLCLPQTVVLQGQL